MAEKLITELTPELADKILKGIHKKMYDDKVSKDIVLHHLKQLKAQMGKLKSKAGINNFAIRETIDSCMAIIDKKIEIINKIK